MGLFGGFKAKFKGHKKIKQKSDGVVVLRYEVNSEFDSYSSSSTNDTPKAVIRQNSKNNNRSIILPPNASENTTETTTNNKHKSVSFPLQESNHEASTVQTDKSFSLTKFEPSDNVENSSRRIPEENKQSSNARKPPANHDASKHQTEIEMKRNSKTEPVSDNQKSIEDDQDDFKVNVVRHKSTTEPPPSEDEVSYTEQEEVSKFVSMGYSSQAASIFFGGEEPATFNRPRRVRLRDDDKNDKNEEDGEAEC